MVRCHVKDRRRRSDEPTEPTQQHCGDDQSAMPTGRAEHRVQLAGGIVQWRAFDRTGQELQSEQVSLPPGERLLQRKGRGDYELYEFKEGTQP